jgi:hypothetical protein
VRVFQDELRLRALDKVPYTEEQDESDFNDTKGDDCPDNYFLADIGLRRHLRF